MLTRLSLSHGPPARGSRIVPSAHIDIVNLNLSMGDGGTAT